MATLITIDMLLQPLPDGPTDEERQGHKHTYPSQKWCYSGSEVEDNRYNHSNFHPPQTWLPDHIYSLNLHVDVQQIKNAYWKLFKDWKKNSCATNNRVNEVEAEEEEEEEEEDEEL